MRLRWMTAGESHGESMFAVLEGVPTGLEVDTAFIDAVLERRQRGYGRGGRMRIETDRVAVPAGLRDGRTLGSPLVLVVANKDRTLDRLPPVTRPRPGHADLAGMLKLGTRDARDVLERSSARSTAALAAAGAVAQLVLRACAGVEVAGFCRSIGSVAADEDRIPADLAALRAATLASEFLCPDAAADEAMRSLVDEHKARGDTLGGIVEVRAAGLPPGLGDHRPTDGRLDGRLAAALLRVPAIKGVEFGLGFEAARTSGSEAHDAILPAPDGGLPLRATNRAGGLEGGMTNGEHLVVRAAMKPLSSLRASLPSVDVETGAATEGARQRSDVCAVPAASVVAEAAVALELAAALLEKTGGDTVVEVRRNLAAFLEEAARLFPADPAGLSSDRVDDTR